MRISNTLKDIIGAVCLFVALGGFWVFAPILAVALQH